MYLAPWILSLFPDRETWHLYREPYFGAGAVLFALDPNGISEAVNDIDGELMNFWSVIQSRGSSAELQQRLELQPFSEVSWTESLQAGSRTPVDRAHAFFVRYRQSRQGLGKDFATPTARTRRGMNEQVSAWLSAIEGLPEAHARLKRVEIRNMDALAFIKKYDHERAVFYCDPPYVISTRHGKGGEYAHEMTDQQHADLLNCLHKIEGRFLLSGYRSQMYDKAASAWGWTRHDQEIDNKASSAKSKEKKTECVWRNF